MATAYAALVSLLNTLDLIRNHPLHSFSFEKKQLESLLERVNFLINFMETSDHNGDKTGASGTLEKRIASAAHAAGYLIDFHVADQIGSGYTRSGKTRVSRFLIDLQKAIDDMEFVRTKTIKFHKAGFKMEQPIFPSSAAASSPSTSLTSQKNTMVGFDDVLLKLFDVVTGEAAGRRVIPIVGMGGIGKTTLARHVFEHKLIVENFDVRLWVTISQKYDVETILNELLSGSTGRLTGGNVVELGVRLYRSLFGRRYLIILDDMWSSEVWYEIMSYFPHDKHSRSKIVVTTRQSDVANHLTSSPFFPLDLLPVDKSWDLFCEKVFGDKNGCPPELKAVGYKIVEKCRGLPLAIIVVGGHLQNSSRTNEYWKYVAKDMDTVLSSGEKSCLDILSLSYSYLPVHLKPCFLYMASFEEDKTIETAILIKLWIGEGFLKQSETHNLEEVAESYLKDLVDRNLILASKRKLNGKIEGCKIHDVVRELCLNIVDKEKFLCVLGNSQVRHWNSQVRHWERRVVSKSTKGDLLKSSPFICSQRVLNDVDVNLLEFGCDQLNLRYLGCLMARQHTPLYISPSIALLWSLQTLFVTSLSNEIVPFVAPYEFWEILQLRHVEINHLFLPDPLPSDCDGLDQTNLQTLARVRNFRLSGEVCKRISHIKNLSISYSQHDAEYYTSEFDDAAYYCLYNLSLLHQLESLDCSFPYGLKSSDFPRSLTFPNSLKELSLSGSCLYWEEFSNMAGLLPLLEALELRSNAVIGPQWDTIEGHFDRLKSLTIINCMDLVYFNVDSSHFPALTNLALELPRKLHELPSSIGELTSLQHIHLSWCSVSFAMSVMRILVEQEQEYGNEGLQLEVRFFFFDEKKRMSFLKQMEEEGLHSNNLLLHK